MVKSKITIDSSDYEFTLISSVLGGNIPSDFSTRASKPDYTTIVNNVAKLLEKSIGVSISLQTDDVSSATVKTFALLEAFRQNLNEEMTLVLEFDGGALTKTYIGKIVGQHQVGIISTSPSLNILSFTFIITGVSW